MQNRSIALLLFLYLSISSFSMGRPILLDTSKNCLQIDPNNYRNVDFNPTWIIDNNIKKIIIREDEMINEIKSISTLHFNSKGFIKTIYNEVVFPTHYTSTDKRTLYSKWNYTYEYLDSFLIQNYQLIQFIDIEKKAKEIDTLELGSKILNLKSAKEFNFQNNKLIRSYDYDIEGKLTEIKDINKWSNSRISLKYVKENRIEISKKHRGTEYSKSYIILNHRGQIVKYYNESNTATHEFFYNKFGEMIQEKLYFEHTEPSFLTYEYIK